MRQTDLVIALAMGLLLPIAILAPTEIDDGDERYLALLPRPEREHAPAEPEVTGPILGLPIAPWPSREDHERRQPAGRGVWHGAYRWAVCTEEDLRNGGYQLLPVWRGEPGGGTSERSSGDDACQQAPAGVRACRRPAGARVARPASRSTSI